MRSPGEQDMLNEIGLRNMIAKFQAMNLLRLKTPAIPRVGIFWVDSSGAVYSESTSLRDAVDYDVFKTHDESHDGAWPRMVHTNPAWSGCEYDEIPRGRVVYKVHPKRPEFIVYIPPQLAKYKARILDEFRLPPAHTTFDTSDEHYEVGD